MKQLQTTRPASANSRAPIAIQSNPNMPETALLVKETETTTVIRERTYLTIAPVCGMCGETKTRIIGMLFECLSEDCPSHDPDPAAAIPLRGEQKEVIDIEPGEARRAA